MKNQKSKIKNQKSKMSLLLVACCLLFTAKSFALVTNINSGATFGTIDGAVTAADSGDTLLVSTGLYSYVSMFLDNKSLSIIGGYNPDFSVQVSSYDTVFEAQGYGVSFSHSTSYIERLTFTGGITGIESYNSSIVTARYCTVENNISYFPGAGLYVHASGILVLQRTYVENNSATNTGPNGYGGGAFVSSSGKLIISESSYIRNNFATVKGGGVYVNGAYFEVSSKAYVSGNTAGEDGGGVYINSGTLLVHDKGDIGYQSLEPNTAGEDGGGIYAVDSLVTFKDSGTYLYNNYAEKKGGGAYISGSMMLVIDDAQIGSDGFACSNISENGGGIYADEGSTVAITNSMIRNCHANFGSAIFSDYSTIFIKDSKIGSTNDVYTNVAKYDGGGIYSFGGTCVVNQTTFLNNRAGDEGGAIFLAECDLTITNSSLENNVAERNGGALFAFLDSIINVSYSTIASNTADFGGGIYWDSKTNMAIISSIITRNNAVSNGGGVFAAASSGMILFDDTSIYNNNANDSGGALFASDSQKLKFIDSYIYNNDADKGGGIFAEQGANIDFTADNKNIYLQSNHAKYGGGIYITDKGSSIDIVATSNYEISMTYNLVNTSGGDIYAGKKAVVNILGDVHITRCTADYGGAIYAAEETKVYLDKIDNYYPVIDNCSADVSGGAVYSITPKTLVSCNGVLFGGSDKGNKAKGDGNTEGGGAVAVLSEAEFRAVDCVFQENSSLANGGAIAVYTATAVIGSNITDGVVSPISNSAFIKNTATNSGYGGAVYVEHGDVSLFNIAIISNRSNRGGGTYANYSDINLSDVLIAKNFSSIYSGGDGIGLFYSTGSVNNCTIAFNYDEGVAVGNGSYVYMTNCIVWGHGGYQVTTNPVQTVVFSDIEGGYPGVGNINSHPLFMDSSALDYQLTEGSPCINSGTNLPWMAPPTTDLEGNERIYDGTVDMGCYEFIPEPCLFIIYYLSFIIYYRRKFNL